MSQPPLGVAETMLPSESAASSFVVSPAAVAAERVQNVRQLLCADGLVAARSQEHRSLVHVHELAPLCGVILT